MENIFTQNWNTPWKHVNFKDGFLDSSILGLDNTLPDAYAEPGNKNEHHGVEFGYIEYLTDTKHKPLIGEDGWLTTQAHDNLHAKYTEKLSQNPNTTQEILDSIRINENFDTTAAHYNILIVIPYDTEGTVQEVFEKHVTPFFTAVQSLTR